MNKLVHRSYTTTLLLIMLIGPMGVVSAKPVVPPQDPTQSITYWKSQVIDPSANANVAMAHAVFNVLLRSWDSARVEPNLYVVNSSTGPWAASLADGNILLSDSAIDVCVKYGKNDAEHLLAFILGHELAHQRSEDLWHQKFLRLAGSQAPEIQAQLLKDLKINPDSIAHLEQREAQADHDGLLIMASVGYNPFKVVDQHDFFTTWVENLWQVSCSNQTLDKSISDACQKAKTRALRTRTQLATAATQSTLFELGIQAYVAGKYNQAQQYFSAFGKDYPNPSVFTNIGLTYLQEAIELDHQIAELDPTRVKFIYPAILASSPLHTLDVVTAKNNKRGATDVLIAQLKQQRQQRIEAAIPQFEKAIRLQPQHRLSYILLAGSYLVDDNLFMTRGILQGKYIPQFGTDAAAENLLAITNFKEGHPDHAIQQFSASLQAVTQNRDILLSPDNARYIISYNLAVVLQQQKHTKQVAKVWQELAHYAKQQGNGYLFQMAVYHINNNAVRLQNSQQLGADNLQLPPARASTDAMHKVSELWLDGNKYLVMRDKEGDRKITDDENHIIAASYVSPIHRSAKTIVIGDSADRPIKLLGMPTRRIQLTSGEYLAYDNLALAIHIVNNQVIDWFNYESAKH